MQVKASHTLTKHVLSHKYLRSYTHTHTHTHMRTHTNTHSYTPTHTHTHTHTRTHSQTHSHLIFAHIHAQKTHVSSLLYICTLKYKKNFTCGCKGSMHLLEYRIMVVELVVENMYPTCLHGHDDN